jgi:hypothetical protein
MIADRGRNTLYAVFAAQGIATSVCFVQGRTSLFLEPLAVLALFSLFLFPPGAFVLAYRDRFHGRSVLTLLASVALSMLQYFLMLPTFS